jgi:hypothetical protein
MQTTAQAKTKRSGSESRQRNCIVKFRAKRDEREEMQANAAAAGLTLGSFLRSLALDSPRTRPVRKLAPAVAELAHFKGQIGRIGGNIHQLLRQANRGEIPDVDELHEAAEEAREILAAVHEVLKGVL